MMKRIYYVLLVVFFVVSASSYWRKGTEWKEQKAKIETAIERGEGDLDEVLPEMEARLASLETGRTLSGIALTCALTAGVVTLVVVVILPAAVERVTAGVYGSGEMLSGDEVEEKEDETAEEEAEEDALAAEEAEFLAKQRAGKPPADG